MVMELSAEGVGAYFGVVFPKERQVADPPQEAAGKQMGSSLPAPSDASAEQVARPEVAAVEQADVVSEPASADAPVEPAPKPEAAAAEPADVVSEPPPPAASPLCLPKAVPAKRLEVVISGMDCARSAFSEPSTATLDASGSIRLHLRQLVDLGSRVRMAIARKEGVARDRHWYCRVYSRSATRTPEGRWIYHLVSANVLDLFRELEPPSPEGGSGTGRSELLLTELAALRAVMIALLRELYQSGILKDDTRLVDLLRHELWPGSG